jgi:hypothetical protein
MCTENCNGCANSVDDDENIDIESYAGCFEAVVMKIDICIRDMRTFSDCRSSGDDHRWAPMTKKTSIGSIPIID